VAVQEVRLDEGDSQQIIIHFSMEMGMLIITGFFVHKGNISAVKRVKFISDRILYVTLRGHWCDILFLMFMNQMRIKVMT